MQHCCMVRNTIRSMKLWIVFYKGKLRFCRPGRIFTKPRLLPRVGFLLHSLDSIASLLRRTNKNTRISTLNFFWEGLKKVQNIVCFHHNPGSGRGNSHICSLETSPEMAPIAPLTVLLLTTFLEAHGSSSLLTFRCLFAVSFSLMLESLETSGGRVATAGGRPRHYHSALLCLRLPLIDTFNQKTEGPLAHPSKPSSSSKGIP